MNVIQHGCRWATVLMLILGISACATPQQTLLLADHPPDIPPSVELDSVPFYPQVEYQCGPAALATVINYYQQSTTPDSLIPLVYIPELKGTLQVEMLAAVKQFKLLAIEQDGRLESVLREIAAGHPVLVMQNLGLDAYPFWHYAVIVGYDMPNQQLIMRSGERKRLIRPFSNFERTWERANYWSVVVVPPDVMAPTATQQQFIQAAVALEPSISPDTAATMYQNGLQRWPHSYVLLMASGNVAFSKQQYQKAEQLFSEATRQDRLRAEGWNNLAYAQLYQGKKQAALASIEQALQLAPDSQQYQDSRLEIVNYPQH